MAERRYNGRVINQNPNMVGVGSTASENAWVGSADYFWRVAQTTNGNNILTEYTSFDGRPCIKMAVNSLTRSGGVVGQLYIGNLAEYAGGTINTANLALYGIKARPNYTYNLSVTYYIESIGADTGSTNFFGGVTYYSSNGVRNTSTPANAFTINQAQATVGQWVTSTGVFAEQETNMDFLGLRIGLTAGADPTTNGNAVIYISNISLTEVLPARTTATSRSTASNRVAVRDMGTALRFDGVDDQVTTTYRIPSGASYSFSGWAYRNNKSNNHAFCGTGNGSNGLAIYLTASNTLIFRPNLGSAGTTFTVNLPVNAYFHWAVTYNRVTAKLYINGKLVGSNAFTTDFVNNELFVIGKCGGGGAFFWPGLLDEQRLWNRALSATEIQNLYLNNVVPQDGLVAEYLFDEASGTTAFDTSGNGNNGTITGATYTLDVPLRPRTSV